MSDSFELFAAAAALLAASVYAGFKKAVYQCLAAAGAALFVAAEFVKAIKV